MTLFAASGAACSGVLGLDPPTLDPCASGGCADGSAPVTLDASGSSDTSVSPESAASDDAPATSIDAPLDAPPEATPDRDASDGVRCGPVGSAIFCTGATPACCLTFDGAGGGDYSCQASAAACAGYPIACATNNDCSGSKVCCFYQSGMKCEDETTASCQSVLVCDPNGAADQCPSGETCSGATRDIDAGVTLPYTICQ